MLDETMEIIQQNKVVEVVNLTSNYIKRKSTCIAYKFHLKNYKNFRFYKSIISKSFKNYSLIPLLQQKNRK
jgi:hypothetical protein